MPSYSWTAPDLVERGPLVRAVVAVSAPYEQALRRMGLPVPDPVPVTALVDTGAFSSAVSRDIATRLSLLPVGEELISAAGNVPRPVRTVKYPVRFVLPTLDAIPTTVIEVQVDETVDAVIGRDILVGAVFIYIGYTGQCTIAF